jgi:hypothetical protein
MSRPVAGSPTFFGSGDSACGGGAEAVAAAPSLFLIGEI